ncbi:hypothetical protein [Lysinibacillus xylanilyticus]|uniref:Uncharacterized protein n=1 Tax=Lysinibacillus xylanilyticus TaxID=582475 RepID=A0A2M9QAQ1_9BACI|nr:hypothetical protein [Lysinibacillus xylanilyticus]PJO45140.1 hypothetical protein CWD94_03700 [Lysinibacillus xylanilyticus]
MKEIKDLLFTPFFSKEKLNPNYSRILSEELPFAREQLKKWAEGFVDRDKKFAKEFQTTFNSSFWELYIFASLKELGLKVNMEYDRPDFVVEGDNGFIIEATIASHAENETPEWQKDYSVKDIQEWPKERIVDNATLRLANAFISKSRKYKKSYNELPHVKNKPYVIAIAPFDSPYFFMQNHQAINRVLYGFDRYIAIDWNDENREILDAIFLEEIEKNQKSNVPLGYFTNSDYSHVSAVIFSNAATFSKVRVMSDDPRITLVSFRRYNDNGTQPFEGTVEKSVYDEHLLDGLVVFHNPFADIPFEIDEFLHPVIAHSTFDMKTKNFLTDFPDGYLYQRRIQVLDMPHATPEKIAQIRAQINKEGEYKQQVFPKFHE